MFGASVSLPDFFQHAVNVIYVVAIAFSFNISRKIVIPFERIADYTIGRIDFRYPTQGIEKEMAQTIAKSDTASLTDRETIHTAFEAAENRYLARHVCWVLTVEGLDTYVLIPRDPSDYESLIEVIEILDVI